MEPNHGHMSLPADLRHEPLLPAYPGPSPLPMVAGGGAGWVFAPPFHPAPLPMASPPRGSFMLNPFTGRPVSAPAMTVPLAPPSGVYGPHTAGVGPVFFPFAMDPAGLARHYEGQRQCDQGGEGQHQEQQGQAPPRAPPKPPPARRFFPRGAPSLSLSFIRQSLGLAAKPSAPSLRQGHDHDGGRTGEEEGGGEEGGGEELSSVSLPKPRKDLASARALDWTKLRDVVSASPSHSTTSTVRTSLWESDSEAGDGDRSPRAATPAAWNTERQSSELGDIPELLIRMKASLSEQDAEDLGSAPKHRPPSLGKRPAAHMNCPDLLEPRKTTKPSKFAKSKPPPRPPAKRRVRRNTVWAGWQNSMPLSRNLLARVKTEGPDFLDELGYGTWTDVLDPGKPAERRLMTELMERLYNRLEEGHYINEVFGNRHGMRKRRMCQSFFLQLLTLARHRIAAFTTPKSDCPGQYDVCYDTPDLYQAFPHYFSAEFRSTSRLNGTGGGRKMRKGAPRDFQEGVHYFKSRIRAVAACQLKEKDPHDCISGPAAAMERDEEGEGEEGAGHEADDEAPLAGAEEEEEEEEDGG
uniref:Uncharacterized protein n=2 Tax=Rhizochromulina marina TaxID=1034831 RepID=A0A7S2RTG2_9STRA|mmetsp:Transcript_20790/g.60756  ORF Transcript_20790/g.60756 Transcript_20790/m.60756 type:complete len:579 (+) Transcript_20790:298-2034(+)|eukprot:CAMPEP_0118974180 /NCGR_PEP_ID=MMETSP1173-20130426/11114_1 /TAXON_ID=1034831 /ORGANISM="Rhizochromulina marina cf, Strain CCMP1243" /LENGTH=578 /DNA_ID=CAMNT_0006923889 /DNA_START=274 /DNA_END=2006 /DNA_ORIENTATION=+